LARNGRAGSIPARGTKDVILWHPFSVKCAIQGGRMAFLSDLKKAQKDIERQKCFRIVSGKY